MTAAIGTRRPREGRCERCDQPLTDEVYETRTMGAFLDIPESTVTDWYDDDAQPGHCMGEHLCAGPSIDWRARALAAEAALKDAEGREALAVSMWNETTLAAQAAARGDGSEPRDVSTDFGIDLFLVVQRTIADAEARGRQSGLFEAWCAVAAERDAEMECYRRSRGQDGGEYWKGVVDTTDEALARVVALAKEATDGR